MIITLTANACLDHARYVASLETKKPEPAARECRQAGGKGVNVARILHALAEDVHAVVVVGGETGEQIRGDLEAARIPHTAVPSPGNSRTYLEEIETQSARSRVEFHAGLRANGEVARATLEALDSLLDLQVGSPFLAASPQGFPMTSSRNSSRCAMQRVFVAPSIVAAKHSRTLGRQTPISCESTRRKPPKRSGVKRLGYHSSAVFLRGAQHAAPFQTEPRSLKRGTNPEGNFEFTHRK